MATFLNAELQDGPYKGRTIGEVLVGNHAVYDSGPHKGKTVGQVADERIAAETGESNAKKVPRCRSA